MTHQQQTALENIVEKGEIARNQHFLLFPQCFLLNQIIVSPFVHIFDIISLFATEFEEPKNGISGNGLRKVKAVRKWLVTLEKDGGETDYLTHCQTTEFRLFNKQYNYEVS